LSVLFQQKCHFLFTPTQQNLAESRPITGVHPGSPFAKVIRLHALLFTIKHPCQVPAGQELAPFLIHPYHLSFFAGNATPVGVGEEVGDSRCTGT